MRIDKWLGWYVSICLVFLGILISTTQEPFSADGLKSVALYAVLVTAVGYVLNRIRRGDGGRPRE